MLRMDDECSNIATSRNTRDVRLWRKLRTDQMSALGVNTKSMRFGRTAVLSRNSVRTETEFVSAEHKEAVICARIAANHVRIADLRIFTHTALDHRNRRVKCRSQGRSTSMP